MRDMELVNAEVESHMRHLVLNISDIYDQKEQAAAAKDAGK